MSYTIVHFSQDFRSDKPQLGGYSRILNICRDTNEHFIFTLTFKGLKIREFFAESNIKVIEIPFERLSFSMKYQLLEAGKISRAIHNYLKKNQIGVDLFFGHSQLVNFFILNKTRKLLGSAIPMLWEMNAIWGHRDPIDWKDRILLKILSSVQNIVIAKSDHILVHSRESMRYVSDVMSIDSRKLSVITNAVTQSETLNEVKIEQLISSRKFLSLGFFDKMNGIPFLVEYLRNSDKKIDITFYGSGQYENLVSKLQEEGKSSYKGIINRSEMIEKMKEYDFVIIPRLPQREADLFIPTKLLEAMANGVIPVCSDVKGMSEVIDHLHNGLLFNAGDLDSFSSIIEYAINMPEEEIVRMKKSAIETVRSDFNWEKNHLALQKIYQKLTRSSSLA
jgi:glycosyltransferase involved in cell wall biosynthesis